MEKWTNYQNNLLKNKRNRTVAQGIVDLKYHQVEQKN